MADIELIVDYTSVQRASSEVGKLGATAKKSANESGRAFQGLTVEQRKNLDLVRKQIAFGKRMETQKAREVKETIKHTQALSANTAQMAAGSAVYAQTANSVRGVGRSMNRTGVLTQQAGYQIGDFIVQVQSGTNAFVAFGQQATQVAGTLTLLGGKWIALGTVLGVTIPLLTAVGAALSRTGQGQTVFTELARSLDTVNPLLTTFASAFNFVKEASIDFANVIVNNLDRVLTTALTVATFFSVKMVAAFVAAKAGAITLTNSLIVLRAALARFLPVAILLAVGELVYQFVRLVRAAGSVGEAFSLVKDVAVESISNIVKAMPALPTAMNAAATSMGAWFTRELGSMIYKFTEFTWAVAEGLNNLFGSNLMGMSGVLTQEFALAANQMEDRARQLRESLEEQLSQAGFSTEAVDRLKEVLLTLEEAEKIDLRNLFSGIGGEEEGKKAANSLVESLTEAQERAQAIADNIQSSMSDAFMSMVDGTASVKDAFKNMAQSIIRQLYEVLVVQQLVGSWNAQTGGSGIVGALMGGLSGLLPSAKGNVFQGGSHVQAFANGGVVNGPTLFPMTGNKTGLMGEAGPEAIMPLTRGPNGKLGVQASGGGGQTVDVRVFVDDTGNFDAKVERISMGAISKTAPAIVNRSVAAVVDRTQRGGSMKDVFR